MELTSLSDAGEKEEALIEVIFIAGSLVPSVLWFDELFQLVVNLHQQHNIKTETISSAIAEIAHDA